MRYTEQWARSRWRLAFAFAAAATATAAATGGCQGSLDDGEGVLQIEEELTSDGALTQAPQPSLPSELQQAAQDAGACAVTISRDRELLVRALPVVEDPVRTRWTGSLTDPSDGAWHFGRLMTEMAGPNDPVAFVRSWLSLWEANRELNGDPVAGRPSIVPLLIQNWPKRDNSLDLTRAPFRLLAIVNRFDLRKSGDAGEGRFVFGVVDPNGRPLQFTVILEYKLPAPTSAAVRSWARDWHALSTLALGSAAYRDQLQRVTDRFAKRDAAPGRVNGSAISQVRTNEIALASPWELREFRLTTTGQLRSATAALTPQDELNNSPALAQFINQNAAAIKAQLHTVPLSFLGAPFRAGAVENRGDDFWNAPGITDPLARHRFSLNTCDGCHGGETRTAFLHVFPRESDQVAALSAFMTGTSAPDPVTGVLRTLNDLGRRASDLRSFLCANP